jgi:calcineurin-like phosphoesterase family protein
MLFGPKRKIRQIKNFYVKCYEHVITSTEVVKYLGVHIDKYLNFENIVSNIVSKVNGRLKFLYRNAKCLDPRSRKTLFETALIQCYFDYSCSSWYSGLGSGSIDQKTSNITK